MEIARSNTKEIHVLFSRNDMLFSMMSNKFDTQ